MAKMHKCTGFWDSLLGGEGVEEEVRVGLAGAACRGPCAAASSSSPALRGGSSEGMDASGLPEDALYLFDTLGWIKIEGALTAAEVAKLNGALEHKLALAGLDEFPESESPQSLINGQIVAPLAGAPLQKLYLNNTRVRSLEPLRGQPWSGQGSKASK